MSHIFKLRRDIIFFRFTSMCICDFWRTCSRFVLLFFVVFYSDFVECFTCSGQKSRAHIKKHRLEDLTLSYTS